MQAIFIDIENELNDIGAEKDLLVASLSLYRRGVPAELADDAPTYDWLAIQGLA